MRKLLITLVCLASLSTAAFAQSDHNDAGPIAVGYSVVTVTGGVSPLGVTGGLVVFQTFGHRAEVPAVQAGVLPATMTTRMVLFATTGDRLARNVGIAMTNPGNQAAVVTLTLRTTSGSVVSSKAVNIAARQQISRFVREYFSDSPDLFRDVFEGSVTVTSNTPVGVMGLRFLGANFSTIPLTSVSAPVAVPEVAPGVGGANALLMPQFAAEGRWSTETIVINHGGSPLTVRIDLFKQDGTPLVAKLNRQIGSSFQNLVIPAGGVITYAPRDANGDSDF